MDTQVTIYDVAKRARVSPASVSRVFSKKAVVAEGTRQRVLEAAAQLKFSANRLAAGLRRGKTDAISLIIPYNTPELMDSAQQAANARHFTMMVCSTFKPNVEAEIRALRMALEHRVAGVIWQPTGQVGDYEEILASLRTSSTAVVLLERGQDIMPQADLVYHDTEEGFRMGIDHLTSAGYRNVAYVTQDANYTLRRSRHEQFERVAGEAALSISYGQQELAGLIDQTISQAQGPVGFLCDDDWTALATVNHLEQIGCRVPQDAGAIVLGDLLVGPFRVGEIARPTISALQRQQKQVAQKCVDWLMERINADPSEVPVPARRHGVAPTLVPRESTLQIS